MTTETEGPQTTLDRVRMGVQFVVGVGLLAYGVGRLTDTIEFELPAVVYLVGGFGLLAYGLFLARH